MQTAGELLGWHPHVHFLVADGGFLEDGSFRHLLWVDGEALERVWRAEVLRLLVERGKIGPEVVESLLSWRHSGFFDPSVSWSSGFHMNVLISPWGGEVARASVLLHSWPQSADGFSKTPPDIFALG